MTGARDVERVAYTKSRVFFQMRLSIAAGIAVGAYLSRTQYPELAWWVALGVALSAFAIFTWEIRHD